MEVGFINKVASYVTLNISFDLVLNKIFLVRKALRTPLADMIARNMQSAGVTSFSSVRFTGAFPDSDNLVVPGLGGFGGGGFGAAGGGFEPATGGFVDSPAGGFTWGGKRRKRQVDTSRTQFTFDLLFSSDAPQEMNLVEQQIRQDNIIYKDTLYTVTDVGLGKNGCPSIPCTQGLCVYHVGNYMPSCPHETAMHLVTFTAYLTGQKWDEAYSDPFSLLHRDVREGIASLLSGTSGSLVSLELKPDNGCIAMFIQWETTTDTNALDLLSFFEVAVMTVGGSQMGVSVEPCVSTTTSPTVECPDTTNLICEELCGGAVAAGHFTFDIPQGDAGTNHNATSDTCPDKHQCCDNCCVRVGYEFSMDVFILLNEDYDQKKDILDNMLNLDGVLQNAASDAFSGFNFPVEVDIHLKAIKPFLHDGVTQAALHLHAYISPDLSYEDLMTAQDRLQDRSLFSPIDRQNIQISHAVFGEQHITTTSDELNECGNSVCHGICKHFLASPSSCTCPPGYLGQTCDTFG